MTATAVERLRPAAMQSRPVAIDQVFAEPEPVLRRLHANGPYETLAKHHHLEAELGGARIQPCFKGELNDPLVLEAPRLLQAARDAFSAEIVQPQRCIVNFTGPMPAKGVHVDLPVFRGFDRADAPVWFLMTMSYSGLFQDWMAPVASGLIWFYRGAAGAFAYWADGIDKPPKLARSPFWNAGLMSDNEFMFHGVAAVGTAQGRAKMAGTLRETDLLHSAGGDAWEIRDGERVVHRLGPDEIRLSLLWKALVFKDGAHARSFEDRSMRLTPDQIVGVYLDDLARRGIKARRPADPLHDPDWRELLEATYPQPLPVRAADNLV